MYIFIHNTENNDNILVYQSRSHSNLFINQVYIHVNNACSVDHCILQYHAFIQYQ